MGEKIDFSKLATKRDLKTETASIRAGMATKKDLKIELDSVRHELAEYRKEWLISKDYIYNMLDKIMGGINEFRESHIVQKGRIEESEDRLQKHEERISSLENVCA